MNVKEVEEKTGLQRSNIRFYEKEGLISPERNQSNGYRDYSDADVEDIKKIAYLRTLGISIEDIRKVKNREVPLYSVIQRQKKVLEERKTEAANAQRLCERLLEQKKICFEDLKIEQFVPEAKTHWKQNQSVFKLDSVSFFYLWGGTVTWAAITLVSLAAAILFYPRLPEQIPVQWSGGEASSLVGKQFLFAYPAACVLIRFFLRPFLGRWLQRHAVYSDFLTNYLTNFLCFTALSVQVFTVLFTYGMLQNVNIVLLADAVVLLGLLLAGWKKVSKNRMSPVSGAGSR